MVYMFSNGVPMFVKGALKENHNASSTITEFPLEDGSTISDHTIIKPKELTIDSGVMDEDTPADTYSSLLKAKDNRELLTIQTKLSIYTNMAIESIDAVEEAKVGDIVLFSLKLKEVRFAKSKQVAIPRSKLKTKKAKDKMQSKKARGQVDHKQVKVSKTSTGDSTSSSPSASTTSNSSMLYGLIK